jgi:hypothetical protein
MLVVVHLDRDRHVGKGIGQILGQSLIHGYRIVKRLQ